MDSERKLTTMGDIERHVATLWDWRNSERQPATIEYSERQPATIGDIERHTTTPLVPRDSERQPVSMVDIE